MPAIIAAGIEAADKLLLSADMDRRSNCISYKECAIFTTIIFSDKQIKNGA